MSQSSPTNGNSAGGSAATTPERDPNSSIINKVRSRVSSILPNSLTKWFSPSNQNGGLRRRREDSDSEELDLDDNTEKPVAALGKQKLNYNVPPTKRTRISVEDEPSVSARQRSAIETSTFRYLTPTLASTSTPNRRKLLGATNHMASPYSFTGYNTDTSTRQPPPEAIVSQADYTTDEELEDDAEQSTAKTQQTNNQKQLYIDPVPGSSRQYGSVQRSYTADSLQRPTVGKNRYYSTVRIGEDNEDDLDNEIELNGLANESASESGDSSTANLRPSVKRPQSTAGRYSTSMIPEERIESQRTLGGLYSSVAENRSKRMAVDSTAGLSFSTHLQTHKSLFSDKNMPNSLNNSTTSLTSLNRRQSFNPSIYGSTSALSDSRLLNTNSPFYNGRTMYGGASAYSRRAVSAQRTLRVPTQIRPQSSLSTRSTSTNSLAAAGASNSEQPTSALSSTAKRILDLMEQFKSPLTDAKKMARNGHAPELAVHVPALVARQKRFDDSDILMNRSIRLSSPKTPYSRNIGNGGSSKRSPPLIANELQVPSMSQLLQMKKVLQNNTEKVRQLASGSQSKLNKEAEYKLPNLDNNANDKNDSKRKMRNKINSTRPSTKQCSNQEPAEEANLPNIQLKLGKSVPVLDNALSKPATCANVSKQNINTAFNTIASDAVSEKTHCSGPIAAAATTIFKFSSPLEIATPSFAKNVKAINNFTFSDPLEINNLKTSPPTSIFATTGKTNKERTVPLSPKPAPQLKTGSVLDALKPTNAVPYPPAVSTLPPLSDMFKPKTDQWECSSCMLRNDSAKTKCVSCESPRPNSVKPISASISLPPITNSFGNQFKPSSGTWECNACMLQNKNTATKCVACETAKPLSNKSLKPLQLSNSLGNQFKPSAGTWECDACMLQNKSDATKCVACTTAKPGSTVALPPKMAAFDQGFQNIVAKQNSKWSCSACMSQNDALRKKCECCDMERPGVAADSDLAAFTFKSAPTANFSFGVKFNDKPTAVSANPIIPSTSSVSSIKPTFSFGVPKPTSEAEPVKPTFSFGVPAVSVNTTIPTVSKKNDSVTSSFSFGAPESNLATVAMKDKVDSPLVGFKFGTSTSTTPSTTPIPADFTSNAVVEPKLVVATTTTCFSTTETTTTTVAAAIPKLGGFAFSTPEKSSAPVSSLSATTTTSIQGIKPSIGGFAFGAQSKLDKPIAEAAKPTFSFGGSSSLKTTEASKGFVAPASSTATTFAFGGSSMSKVVTPANSDKIPTFGAASAASNAITTIENNKPLTLGAVPAISNTTTDSSKATFLFGSPSTGAVPIKAAAPSFGVPTTATPSPKNTNFFASANSAGPPNQSPFGISSAQQCAPVFGATNTMPSRSATTAAGEQTIAPEFKFGANAGGVNATVATPTFGKTVTTPVPTFGLCTLPPFGSFGAASGPSAFGSPNTFGSSASSGSESAPTFGNSPAFGNQNVPAFGAPAGISATPAFGVPAMSFGATPTPTGFTTPSFDEPQAKKWSSPGFGSQSGSNQAKPPAYSFGSTNSNSSETKTPFAFSANTPPSFNFGGQQQQQQPQQTQQPSQPFAFGASNSVAPNAGVFSFGSGPTETSTDERERSPTTTENSSNPPQRSRPEKMNSQLTQWRHHSDKQPMAPVSESYSHHGPLKFQPRYPSTSSETVTAATKNVYRLNNRRPTLSHSYVSRQSAASGVVTNSAAVFKKPQRHPQPHNKYSINRTIPIVTTPAAVEVPLATGIVSNKRKYDTSKYKYISPDAYKSNGTSPESIDLEYSKDSKH